MRSESIVLGIDLATATARVLAVGVETGQIIAQTDAPLALPVRAANAGRGQRANYAEVVFGLIKSVTAALGAQSRNIRALCTTGTSGTIVPCNSLGVPSGDALMYDDQRAAAENREISAQLPKGPYAALARALWLERNAPAEKYVNTPDVVHAALAGALMASDTSHALKSAIDVENGDWDLALLARLSLPVEKMGVLVHPGAVIGAVSDSVGQHLGLPAGVDIIAGMTDGCTAQIGAGAMQVGDIVGVLGTTLVLKSVAAQNVCSADFVVYSHKGPNGNYWPGGASNVGAGALGSRFGTSSAAILAGNQMAQRHGPASGVCYPLTGQGERFPFKSTTAKFFATGGDGSDADNYRAVMEGVAFVERLSVERLETMGVVPKRFLATGGGSSSGVWNTIRATTLGRSIHRPQAHNSAFGAAMIAAATVTAETLAQISTRIVAIEATFEPDGRQTAALEENYQRFLAELRNRGYLPGSGSRAKTGQPSVEQEFRPYVKFGE